MRREGEEARSVMDSLAQEKDQAEKIGKSVQAQINEVQTKLDEATRCLGDFDASKKKLIVENADMLRNLEEADGQISLLSKLTITLGNNLDEARRVADEENKVRRSEISRHITKM